MPQLAPTLDSSRTVLLQFDIKQLVNKVHSQENSNTKLADVTCQLVLLSSDFNLRLDKIISFLVAWCKIQTPKDVDGFTDMLMNEAELYVNESIDALITDLMENYPLLLNGLFDHMYFAETGKVRLTNRENFLSQFDQNFNEVSQHYDFICQDRMINRLLTNYNELLAIVIDFESLSNSELKGMIIERVFNFFQALYHEMSPFFREYKLDNFIISQETVINQSGDTIFIMMERSFEFTLEGLIP